MTLRRRQLMKGFTDKTIKNIRCNYVKFPLLPKTKEVHFKTLNNIYPSKEYLHSKFNIGDNTCTFCDSEIETDEHLFFACTYSKIFWDSFCVWIAHNLDTICLSYNDIKLGVTMQNKNYEYIVNNLILLGKFFIHKCKFGSVKPIFIVFLKEVASFKKIVKTM